MRFKLIIDNTKDEEVTITAHQRTELIDQIEALVLRQSGTDRIAAWDDEEMILLPFGDIECITAEDNKTYAIDSQGRRYRLKHRLYELEALLPPSFIRINKSALANIHRLERFTATFGGAVDARFRCGYSEYVSRRCFAAIKRRFEHQ